MLRRGDQRLRNIPSENHRGTRKGAEITLMETSVQDEGEPNRRCAPWCPRITIREFIFILVVTLTELGCNISLETPGALQDAIMKNYHLTAFQFSLFYSLYYCPTVLLNGINGFLIDRVMGIKLSTLVYSLVGVVGVGLFSAGSATSLYWLMLMGRLIFGLGNEMATGVCVNYCIFSWYRNTIVNVIASLFYAGAMCGSLIIYQAGPRLINLLQKSFSEKEALDIVIFIASGSFLLTGCFAILMTHLKPRVDPNLNNNSSSPESQEKMATLKDIKKFPLVYWLLCLLCVLNAALNTFAQFSQGMLTSTVYKLDVIEASNAVTAMNAVTVAVSVPVSLSVDIMGRNTWYVTGSFVITTLAYILFMFRANPYIGMILVGMGNSMYSSAILPMFAYPLEKHLVGSCYGIMSTVGGISMSLSPLLVGRLIDGYGYSVSIYLYFATSSISLLFILVIWILDKRSTGVLSMTPKQRIEHEQSIEIKRIPEAVDTESFANYSSISCLVD